MTWLPSSGAHSGAGASAAKVSLETAWVSAIDTILRKLRGHFLRARRCVGPPNQSVERDLCGTVEKTEQKFTQIYIALRYSIRIGD